MGIRGSVVGRLLLIDVAGSVAVLGLWYLVFSTYNRKKGTAALRWVQTACAGKGRILDSHWVGRAVPVCRRGCILLRGGSRMRV